MIPLLTEMKSTGSSMHKAAMMPSPACLWRMKVILFLIWGFGCCKIGRDSVMRMSADLRDLFVYEAFLYYNPLLLVTMMVWLWGVNLWVFSQGSVNYAKVFDIDQNHLTHQEIWKCSTWMTVIVPTSMTAYLYLYSHGEVSLAASQPVFLYVVVAIVLIFPFDIFYLSSRYFLLRTVWRIALPLQPITFPDFFVADILTSMVKIWSARFVKWSIDRLRQLHGLKLIQFVVATQQLSHWCLLFHTFVDYCNVFVNTKIQRKRQRFSMH